MNTTGGRPRQLRVLSTVVGRAVDPWVVFNVFYGRSRTVFWLDSSRPGGETGRFSFLGDASGPLARIATADVWREQVTVRSAAGERVVDGGMLDFLAADLAGIRIEAPSLPFDFGLGWVGFLGYELKAECGGDRRHRSSEPDAGMVFVDRMLAFDHQRGEIVLLALAEAGDTALARRWIDASRRRLMMLADAEWGTRFIPRQRLAPGMVTDVRLRHDRTAYLAKIRACLRAIEAGESYEICLTNMITATGEIDPVDCYGFLRTTSPAPFAAFLRYGGFDVFSTSMERFLRVRADGMVESRPIKGTRPRSADPAEDRRLADELIRSEKDRAENVMIVDLVRNDLARCSEVGSVAVPGLFEVESYATVHQLVSTVTARLRPDVTAVDCLRAAFPGGSMTGAPKKRTMEIIDELEEGPRGVYSGAIGYFSLTGAADFSIVIRTLVRHGDRLSYGVGGAITALSDPLDEFEETAVKAEAFLRLVNAPFPERDTTPSPSTAG